MQEGLTIAVAQVLTSFAKIIFILIILYIYNPWIPLIVAVSLTPSIAATRWAFNFMIKSAAGAQGAKGKMSAMTEETISNVKTVKCFAEEANHIEKF